MKIGRAIADIWNTVTRLKNGIIQDLAIDSKHRKKETLQPLSHMGQSFLKFLATNKMKPESFSENWNFKSPNPEGGGSIFEGSEMTYSANVIENHLLFDHILIQFIADSEFYTNRAFVEIWKAAI